MQFCDKPTIHMNVEDIKYILNKIRNMSAVRYPKIYEFNRYYHQKNLENDHYLLTFRSFGDKHLLFLTTINGKKYSLFISCPHRQRMTIYNVKMRFNEDLYLNDTIIDGEILKNEKDNWNFIVNDIVYYKGQYVNNYSLRARIEILSDILRKQYKFDDFLNSCHLQLRSYFIYNHLEMMHSSQNNEILMVPENPNNYLLSFKIKNLSDNKRLIKNLQNNKNKLEENKFFVIKTETPDVYHIYKTDDINPSNFKGIACISTMSQSFYMKKLFDELDENQKGIFINFSYNNHLKSWEPDT